jgi:hypothetical protein
MLDDVGHGLDLVVALDAEERADLVDGALAGGVDQLGQPSPVGARSSTGASFEVAFSRLAA